MREDIDDHIKGLLGPVVAVDRDQLDGDAHAARLRQGPRLGLSHGREIDRQDIEPLLGQPHAIAAFPVGDGERVAPLRQQVPVRCQKRIGLGPENIFGDGESAFPALEFAHEDMPISGASILAPP